MLPERLKLSTQTVHCRVEQLLAAEQCLNTLPAYAALLRLIYGYFQPLESKLFNSHFIYDVPEVAQRLHEPWLRADLLALGATDETLITLPRCSELPFVEDEAEFLGCLYVREGATLGGRIIAQELRGTLDLKADNGARFFHGYGEHTTRMWKGLQNYLIAREKHGVDVDRAIRSAVTTFELFANWIEETR